MNELIKLAIALTKLANETTEYVRRLNGAPFQPALPMAPTAAAGEEKKEPVAADGPQSETETMTPNPAPAEEPKKRKPRAPKVAAEDNPTMNQQAKEPPAAPAALTEEESLTKLGTVAKAFVTIYQDATPNGNEIGKTALAERYKKAKMGDLTHAERIDFIAFLEGKIAEKK